MEFSKDLNAASASPLILTLLQADPSYGYAIIRQVEKLSEGALKWEEGMLYPILHRMEVAGWIEGFWEKSNSGRRRKYYRILNSGRNALAEFQMQWKQMDSILRNAWTNQSGFEVGNVENIEDEDEELPVSLL